MHSFLTWFQLFLSLALVVAILIHPAKGMGLGSMGGSAQLFGSQKGAETGLNRITGAIIALWLGSAILLSSHVIAQPAPAPIQLPVQQNPIKLPTQKLPTQKLPIQQAPGQKAPDQAPNTQAPASAPAQNTTAPQTPAQPAQQAPAQKAPADPAKPAN